MTDHPTVDAAYLAERRRLAGEAASGPWVARRLPGTECVSVIRDGLRMTVVAECNADRPCWEEGNAAFIADARTSVPVLCAEVANLHAAIERFHNGYQETGRANGWRRPESHAVALTELLTEQVAIATEFGDDRDALVARCSALEAENARLRALTGGGA